MARRRRSRSSHQRDDNSVASRRLHDDIYNPVPSRHFVLSLADRRFFSPVDEVMSPVRLQRRVVVDQANVNKRHKDYEKKLQAYWGKMYFNAPQAVTVCVRRKERRETLFALRKTGKGARSRKRRNSWSDVRC